MSGVGRTHKTGNRSNPTSGHHIKIGCSFCSTKFFTRRKDSQQDRETRTQLLQCLATQMRLAHRRVPKECTRSSFPLCQDCLSLMESLRKTVNNVDHDFKKTETLLESIKMKVKKGVRMDLLAHRKAKKLAPPSNTSMIFQIRKMILAGSRFRSVAKQVMHSKSRQQPLQREKVQPTRQGKEESDDSSNGLCPIPPQVFYSSGSSTPWKIECNWTPPGSTARVKENENVESIKTENQEENMKNYVLPSKIDFVNHLRTKANVDLERPNEGKCEENDSLQVYKRRKIEEKGGTSPEKDGFSVIKARENVPELLQISDQSKLRRSTRILEAVLIRNGKQIPQLIPLEDKAEMKECKKYNLEFWRNVRLGRLMNDEDSVNGETDDEQ